MLMTEQTRNPTGRFDAPSIIGVKRDGGAFRADEIVWVVDGYVSGQVSEGQMASLAMAITLNGMDTAETLAWTTAMAASGERLELSSLSRPHCPTQ